ncbi:MAG TPA: hypothetical protein VKU83_10900 [Puia sp.]|nr:hypothetical protein [Puia sp.]
MQYTPYTNLQAAPDFANFNFISPTLPGPIERQVRFISQPGGQIYLVDFRNKPAESKEPPNWPESKDFLLVTCTLLQIVEIYTERYPQRVLRFRADSRLKRLIFLNMALRFENLLSPLFLVDKNDGGLPRPEGDPVFVFQVQRKPVPFVAINTVQSTWNGTSRIFGKPFKVEIDRSIRVGMTVPVI